MKIFFILLLTLSAPLFSRVISYEVEVRPDFQEKSLQGKTIIHYKKQKNEKEVSFPVHDLVIDRLVVNGKKFSPQIKEGNISLPVSSKEKELIEISYHGKPLHGLVFGKNYVYTVFHTCEWMICDENPGVKSDYSIEVIVPERMNVVASGDFISKKTEGKLIRYRFQENRPYSSYLFGFSAGEFTSALFKNVQILGIDDSKEKLLQKFKETPDVIKFFEEKSGVPLPHALYTQVLVPGSEAQEISSFSVLGKEVIDPILKNPQEDWAIVHELAHQWWGNLVTCKSWKHFWLNEGITSFMVAAWKEHHFGRPAYQKELELFQKRYQRAKDAKLDVPLTYEGEFPDMSLKRAIVYSKGALFMHALRSELGDETFWKGLKNFTHTYQGTSVETKNLQETFEAASGKKLQKLFNQWAY